MHGNPRLSLGFGVAVLMLGVASQTTLAQDPVAVDVAESVVGPYMVIGVSGEAKKPYVVLADSSVAVRNMADVKKGQTRELGQLVADLEAAAAMSAKDDKRDTAKLTVVVAVAENARYVDVTRVLAWAAAKVRVFRFVLAFEHGAKFDTVQYELPVDVDLSEKQVCNKPVLKWTIKLDRSDKVYVMPDSSAKGFELITASSADAAAKMAEQLVKNWNAVGDVIELMADGEMKGQTLREMVKAIVTARPNDDCVLKSLNFAHAADVGQPPHAQGPALALKFGGGNSKTWTPLPARLPPKAVAPELPTEHNLTPRGEKR